MPDHNFQWREVSTEEFYRVIGPQNVHPQSVGPYPYTSIFKTPSGETKGKAVGYFPDGSAIVATRYLLPC